MWKHKKWSFKTTWYDNLLNMPLPTPNKDETKNTFISRCIETEIMSIDFPNLTQRIAVCVSQFDNKPTSKTKTK